MYTAANSSKELDVYHGKNGAKCIHPAKYKCPVVYNLFLPAKMYTAIILYTAILGCIPPIENNYQMYTFVDLAELNVYH